MKLSATVGLIFALLCGGCAFWKTTSFIDDRDHPVFIVTEHAAGLLIGPCNPYVGAQKGETRFMLKGRHANYSGNDIEVTSGGFPQTFDGAIIVDWKKREITIAPKDKERWVHGIYHF
jgi:hypothetical protein